MKKSKSKLLKYYLIGIIILLLGVAACIFVLIKNNNTNNNTNKLSYAVSPCNNTDKETFTAIIMIDDNIFLHQKISYVCCANITLNYVVSDDILQIFEENTGEMCKCICNYEITASLKQSGINKVQIYGIKFQDIQPYDLLYEQTLENIEKKSCDVNDDCICGGRDKTDESCFVGNKEYYAVNVDATKTCPDFCTGIAGNLVTRCIENQCKIVNQNILSETYCDVDSDCVRQSSCCDCNAGYYVNKKYYKDQNCQIRCMCMSRPSVGKCINNQCEGVIV